MENKFLNRLRGIFQAAENGLPFLEEGSHPYLLVNAFNATKKYFNRQKPLLSVMRQVVASNPLALLLMFLGAAATIINPYDAITAVASIGACSLIASMSICGSMASRFRARETDSDEKAFAAFQKASGRFILGAFSTSLFFSVGAATWIPGMFDSHPVSVVMKWGMSAVMAGFALASLKYSREAFQDMVDASRGPGAEPDEYDKLLYNEYTRVTRDTQYEDPEKPRGQDRRCEL